MKLNLYTQELDCGIILSGEFSSLELINNELVLNLDSISNVSKYINSFNKER